MERAQTTPGFLTTTFTVNEAAGTLTTTNPAGATTMKVFNNFGQLVSTFDGNNREIDNIYDKWGRLIADADIQNILHDYYRDAASRIIRTSRYVTATTSSNTDYYYDNRNLVTQKVDDTGATTTMAYDARGLMTSMVEPVTSTTTLTTTLGYDASGNNTRRTNPAGAASWYTYNTWQKPESTIEPSTTSYPNPVDRTYTTSYTADRDIANELEPGNITRAYTYLTGQQLGTITSKLGATTSAAITYTRDLIGRQTKAVSGTSTIVTGYNDRDLPTQVTNGTTITNYTYDNASRLATRADQAGTTSFTYDNADHLKTLADPLTGLTATYNYDTKGRLGTTTTGPSTRTYTYDVADRVVTDTTSTTTGPQLSTTNAWNNLDQLTQRTTGPASVPGAGIETFAYDQVARLTS